MAEGPEASDEDRDNFERLFTKDFDFYESWLARNGVQGQEEAANHARPKRQRQWRPR